MSMYEIGHVEPGYLYYREPLDTPVEITRSKAEALFIHHSDAGAQPGVTETIRAINPDAYDRLAFPNPSENIVYSPLVLSWVRLLKQKHDFDIVHVCEAPNRFQRFAREVVRENLPGVDVEYWPVPIQPEQAVALAVQCPDLRFQDEFDTLLAEEIKGPYARISIPGSTISLKEQEAMEWATSEVERSHLKDVVFMGHTDCAMTDGLAGNNFNEYAEAQKHARASHVGATLMRAARPHLHPRVKEHLVGIQGRFELRALQKHLGLR